MADSEINENPASTNGTTSSEVVRVEERPEHGMKILQGLNKLKIDRILCDVTLIAEGNEEAINHFHRFSQTYS